MANSLVEAMRAQEESVQVESERLFKPGEHVRLTEAPFTGIEGIYQMAEGERRVTVLIELLSKQVKVQVAPDNLRKVAEAGPKHFSKSWRCGKIKLSARL